LASAGFAIAENRVPEPASMGLVGAGPLGLGLMAPRKTLQRMIFAGGAKLVSSQNVTALATAPVSKKSLI
jgi:hypothetical protein